MSVLIKSIVAALAVVLIGVVPAASQTATVSPTDIERLRYALDDARRDVSQLRTSNAALADRLQTQLDELGEEVVYLKVKLRKESSIQRSEYSDLRDRIDDVRNRARGSGSSAGDRWNQGDTARTPETARYPESRSSTSTPARSAPNEIPVGQELDVRLQTPLNSGTAQVEDRIEATTLVDVFQDERVLIPAGSMMRGVVTSVDPASRTDRKGSITVVFDQLTVNGRTYTVRGTVTQALESEGLKGETGRIATGAGVGAIIGGILGGFKGALAGILIGGGGTVVATEGKNVDLPAGTVLRVRFDSPVTLR
jgi:hypothetical protein